MPRRARARELDLGARSGRRSLVARYRAAFQSAEPPLRPPLSWKCFSASSLSGRRLVTARAPAENPAAVKALTPRGVAASALMLCGCGAEDFSRSPIGPVVYLTLSIIVCSTRQYFVTL